MSINVPEETQLLDGSIYISRRTGGAVGECVSIRIEDSNSHCLFFEAEIGMEAWGQAVSGRGNVPIKFELRKKAPVGLYRHQKVEYVPAPEPIYGKGVQQREEEEGRKLLAPFETDGWKGSTYDLFNRNNTVKPPGGGDGDWKRRVTFVRYMDYPMPNDTDNKKLEGER